MSRLAAFSGLNISRHEQHRSDRFVSVSELDIDSHFNLQKSVCLVQVGDSAFL